MAARSKGVAQTKGLGQKEGFLTCDAVIPQARGKPFLLGWMGRCSALTRVDLTRRPQALGGLQLIFGLPAHLHVLCSIWAFLIRPKQNHKSGGADAVRLPSSSTPPQSSEVIDCMPQPSTWHDVWELSLNLSQHPYLLSPSFLHLFPFLSSITQLFECQGSDVLAPHHPSTPWSRREAGETYGIYITVIYYSSLNLSRSHPCMLQQFSHTVQIISVSASWHYKMVP